jgi:hypothetical protein
MKIDQVLYQIKWEKFRTGYSFFIPCVDHKTARKVLKNVTKRLQINIVTKVVIVEGIKGIRVWKI